MKPLIAGFIFLFSTITFAQTLEAPSIKDILNKVSLSEFEFKGKGRVFGFESTDSCLFVSEDISILKNYCNQSENSTARSYTIFSKEFGIIELYEEKLENLLKKDVRILGFQENLKSELNKSNTAITIGALSNILETIYTKYLPGCWSTNFDKRLMSSEAKCSKKLSISNFESWSEETQDLVFSEKDWTLSMDNIGSKLQRR